MNKDPFAYAQHKDANIPVPGFHHGVGQEAAYTDDRMLALKQKEANDYQFRRAFDILRQAAEIRDDASFMSGLRDWIAEQKRDLDKVLR
jgi:hypothetical protein